MLLRHEYLSIGMKYSSQGIKIYKSTPGTAQKNPKLSQNRKYPTESSEGIKKSKKHWSFSIAYPNVWPTLLFMALNKYFLGLLSNNPSSPTALLVPFSSYTLLTVPTFTRIPSWFAFLLLTLKMPLLPFIKHRCTAP